MRINNFKRKKLSILVLNCFLCVINWIKQAEFKVKKVLFVSNIKFFIFLLVILKVWIDDQFFETEEDSTIFQFVLLVI